MLTVTFGVSASPFQAIRMLHQLKQDSGHAYPEAHQSSSYTQTYVDDIIGGVDSVSNDIHCQEDYFILFYLCYDFIQLLAEARFVLKNGLVIVQRSSNVSHR